MNPLEVLLVKIFGRDSVKRVTKGKCIVTTQVPCGISSVDEHIECWESELEADEIDQDQVLELYFTVDGRVSKRALPEWDQEGYYMYCFRVRELQDVIDSVGFMPPPSDSVMMQRRKIHDLLAL